MNNTAHPIPFTRLLRRYRAKAFVRNKVKLNSAPGVSPVTPELLREAGANPPDDDSFTGHSTEPALAIDDKQRISNLEREVRLIRQNIMQLWLRR